MKHRYVSWLLPAFAALCLFGANGCDRTADSVVWERTYAGPDFVTPVAVIRSPDSGYAVLANIRDKWTGAEGIWLLRLDDQGDTIWTRTYILSTETSASDILPYADGWFIISGRSSGTPFLHTVRSDGQTEWSVTWPELSDDAANGIAPAPESTVVMAGQGGWNLVSLQRTTPTGYVFWARTCTLTFDTPSVQDVAKQDSGGYFICGGDFGLGVSESGESLWSHDYSSLGTVDLRKAEAAPGGGVYLAGSVYTETGSRIICAKTASNGEVTWSRRVDDPPASGWAVCADGGGGCYVVGGTDRTDDEDGIVVKLDAAGNIVWQREFNGPQYGELVSAAMAPDGDVVVLGSTNNELRLLKLNP